MKAEISLKKYKGLTIKKSAVKVTDDEIEQRINRELFGKSELVVSENDILNVGDIAVFDFAGSLGGKAFQGGSAENYTLEIGSKMFIPGFEEQMIGMKRDEVKVINVTFPENYQAKDLAGKDCEFTIKLHEIKQRSVPTLCDETVKKFAINGVSTVNEFRKYICDTIYAEKDKLANNHAIDALYHKLFDENDFIIPSEMVEKKANIEIERAKAQAESYGVSFDEFLAFQGIESEDALKNIIRSGIENLLKRDLLLNAIAEKEGLEVSEAEFESYYKMLAENEKLDIEKVKEKYTKEFLRSKIILFKAEDFLVSSTTFQAQD